MKPLDRLREMQLAHLGKLMAGLSHEFKNHLAIIKESSGLIEDLLMLADKEPLDRDRLIKIIAAINERISQAAEMCRFLSGFSHRMDQPLSSFRIADILQEEIYLMSRFARQKQVNLTAAFSEDHLPAIFNDPSLLQLAVFCIIWPALESLDQDGRILISLTQQNNCQEINIHVEGAMKEPPRDNPWQEILPDVLQILGAELSHRSRQKETEEVAIKISSIESSIPTSA